MPYTTNIVLAGDDFHRAMFDEREVLPIPMDREKTVAGGPYGEFTYAQGYKLTVEPERITVAHTGDAILPDTLVGAAAQLAGVLQSRDGHTVTGIGMNLQTNFTQSGEGMTGTDFCSGVLVTERLSALVGGEVAIGCARAIFFRSGMQHDVRLEPHFRSNGANLFLSVHIHQVVAPEDDLTSKLAPTDDVRAYLTDLCGRVSTSFQEPK